MDRDRLEASLDAALVNDEELAAGPHGWAGYQDPLPSWEPRSRDNKKQAELASA
jgi:hypothetical protein